MNYKQEEKNRLNIDLINIALVILICIPIFFVTNYISDSLQKSELLSEQTEYIDELKTLYLEVNNSKKISENPNEDNRLNEKISRAHEIEFKLEYIKQLQEPNSLRNDLIKFVLSAIIALLLSKILIERKNKLKRLIE